MNDYFERLTFILLERNDQLSYEQARTWVENLWEDFETTRAKAGRKYEGKEVTEKIVLHWIHQYGPYLHKYKSEKEQFKHLNEDRGYKH